MYQYLDAALVRAPAWEPSGLGLPWPDLTGPGATTESWREWLCQAWQIPEFAEAVGAASPDLERQVSRIRASGGVPDAAVRRAVLSTMRYLLRGTHRATPFGMLAGVAPARTGPRAVIRAGTRHWAVAKADATWLTGVIEALESDDRLLPRLTVSASNLVVQRDGQLVLGYLSTGSAGGAPDCVQIRATRPARTALQAARSPIRVSDLATQLAAAFPAATADEINTLVARLIRHRFLLTSLRAPMTVPHSLATLLGEMEAMAPGDARTASLRAVTGSLASHNIGSVSGARDERRDAVALMRSMHPSGQAIAVDLRLDWDLVVPEAVAA
jgi:hypothetical protein